MSESSSLSSGAVEAFCSICGRIYILTNAEWFYENKPYCGYCPPSFYSAALLMLEIPPQDVL